MRGRKQRWENWFKMLRVAATLLGAELAMPDVMFVGADPTASNPRQLRARHYG
jgi:hypothetical protein